MYAVSPMYSVYCVINVFFVTDVFCVFVELNNGPLVNLINTPAVEASNTDKLLTVGFVKVSDREGGRQGG